MGRHWHIQPLKSPVASSLALFPHKKTAPQSGFFIQSSLSQTTNTPTTSTPPPPIPVVPRGKALGLITALPLFHNAAEFVAEVLAPRGSLVDPVHALVVRILRRGQQPKTSADRTVDASHERFFSGRCPIRKGTKNDAWSLWFRF